MHAGLHPDTPAWKDRVSTCLLVAAWLYANLSSLEWLHHSLAQASRLNLVLVGFVVTVLLVQLIRTYRRGGVESHPFLVSTTIEMRSQPVLLMLGCGVIAIALKWLVNIEQINAILFALGTYGLCGLFLTPNIWRKYLPVAALVACILPFSAQFGTGLGLPMRILTANAVEQLLSVWQVVAVSSQDIIVLENGIAHVDITCSGVKSLWTGTLFLLAVTWLENRIMGARWLLVCVSNLIALISANIIRVLLLVLITYVWKQPQIAEILHLPLGLLGFIAACALTWVLLQKVPKQEGRGTGEQVGRWAGGQEIMPHAPCPMPHSPVKTWLLAVVIALAVIAQIQPPQAKPLAIASIQWPTQMVSEAIPLTAAEQRVFNDPGITSQKRRFVWGNLSGSMLLVSSTAWDTYHPPELCFVGNGFKVDRMERKLLTPSVQARWLSLQNGQLSAAYWFQSPQQTTDGFLNRIRSQITHRNQTWVMVSVLFNSSPSSNGTEISNFASAVHQAIADQLNLQQ